LGQLESDLRLLWIPIQRAGVRLAIDSHDLGLRAAPLGKMFFERVRLSADDILAEGETASRAFQLGLERELLLLTSRSVGTARAAFEYAAQYAMQRTAFGRPIADHQAIAFMVADLGIRVDAARALLWNATWAVDAANPNCDAAVRAACEFSFDHVVGLTSDALQILGGHGYIQDHPLEKWMRDARTLANCGTSVTASLARLKPSSV
jgi:alkylation response protein AidB-like acyl-CoA dehydrogenase